MILSPPALGPADAAPPGAQAVRPAPRPPVPFGPQLLRLVLAVALPLSVFAAALAAAGAGARRAEVLRGMAETTRAVQVAVDGELRAAAAALQALAASPELDAALGPEPFSPEGTAARAAFRDRAIQVVRRHPGTLLAVTLLLPNGDGVAHTQRPLDAPLGNVSAAGGADGAARADVLERWAEILAGEQATAVGVFRGSVVGRDIVAVGAPVRRDGRVLGGIVASLPLDGFVAVLRSARPAPGWAAAVIDHHGLVVAREPHEPGILARPASDAVLSFQRSGAAEGTVRTVRADGTAVRAALRRVGTAPWLVTVSAAEAVLDAPVWRSAGLAAAGGGVAAALAATAAVLLAGRLRRDLRGLAAAAAARGAAPPWAAARIPPARTAEVAAARDALDRAGAALRARAAALRASEARVRLAGEAAGVGLFERNLATGAAHWSAAMYRLYGLDPSRPPPAGEAGAPLDLVHPEDRAGVRAALADGAADPGRGGFALEFRARRADTGAVRWMSARGEFGRDAAGRAALVRGAQQDVTERREAEDRLRLMGAELNHRVKNTLATVQSLAAQTLRGVDAVVRRAFDARLAALAAAHDVLTREGWAGADLDAVVAGALAPHGGPGDARFRVGGPAVRLRPRAALSLGMALHELATNAAKYGALSQGAAGHGRVELRWGVVGGEGGGAPRLLRVVWRETGGPPVAPPARRGFGTRLVERSLTQDLGGTVSLDFAPGGVTCVVEAPLAAVAAPSEAAALPRVGAAGPG